MKRVPYYVQINNKAFIIQCETYKPIFIEKTCNFRVPKIGLNIELNFCPVFWLAKKARRKHYAMFAPKIVAKIAFTLRSPSIHTIL